MVKVVFGQIGCSGILLTLLVFFPPHLSRGELNSLEEWDHEYLYTNIVVYKHCCVCTCVKGIVRYMEDVGGFNRKDEFAPHCQCTVAVSDELC